MIKMLKDHVAAYNGVDHMTYKAGEVYTKRSAHEGRVFELMVASGKAQWHDPARPAKETKVTRPKAAKRHKAG
jgi:hypothetical protein